MRPPQPSPWWRPLIQKTKGNKINSETLLAVKAIGFAKTPFVEKSGTPIQPVFGAGAEGEIIIDDEYAEALSDIEGFERIWVIFWLHKSEGFKLKVVPYRDTQLRGLFATRAPARPNPIGISSVRLIGRSGNRLKIAELDPLDGTPILDIKPYVPAVDSFPNAKTGWFGASDSERTSADNRF